MQSSNHNQPYKSTGFRWLIDACEGVLLRAPENVEFEVFGRIDDLADEEPLSKPLTPAMERASERLGVAMERVKSLAHEGAIAAASDPMRMLTAKDAAAWLRKSRSYVYRHADELGARRLGEGRGADLLFRLGELETWLDQHRERQP